MKHIGVVADNIKDAFSVIRELKRLRIPFEILGAGCEVPSHVMAIIVCGPRPCIGFERAIPYEGDARSSVLSAISLASQKEAFDEVVVGIDPGESTGFATIADGELIEAYVLSGSEADREVRRILGVYPAKKFRVRIGTGRAFKASLDFLHGDPRVIVEYVEETKKGVPPAFFRKGLRKDAKSALTIALSGGRGGFGAEV